MVLCTADEGRRSRGERRWAFIPSGGRGGQSAVKLTHCQFVVSARMLQLSANTVPAPTFTTLRPRYSYPAHSLYPPLPWISPHRLLYLTHVPWCFPVLDPLAVSVLFPPTRMHIINMQITLYLPYTIEASVSFRGQVFVHLGGYRPTHQVWLVCL
jgi:hypothetical protein